jgi:flagellar motor switch protein FliM
MPEIEAPPAYFFEAGQMSVSAFGGGAETSKKEHVPFYDFRNSTLLSPEELRKLRAHHEGFTQGAANRLSIHLGLEFSLKLTGVKTIPFQKLGAGWSRAAHLTLFKMEPLRGISILEISSQLGLCMVDRLMGGPGYVPSTDQEMSEVEKALLEQSVQLLLEEWCGCWSGIKELKPVILGYESNDGFIQTAPPETIMLVVSMEAGFGGCRGQIQMGFPYAAVDPLIRRSCKSAAAVISPAPSAPPLPAPASKWNSCFDGVCVPVTAEWEGLEMTARQIFALKVGDVLPLDAQRTQQVNVRVADRLSFQGRPGTLAGQWAVELTQAVNR